MRLGSKRRRDPLHTLPMRARFRSPRLVTILGALFVLALIFNPTGWASPPDGGHDDGHGDGDDVVEDEGEGDGDEHGEAAGHGDAHGAEPAAHSTGEHGEGPVFVTPPAEPTKVKVGMYLISLVEVSAPNESFPTFRAELFMDLEWNDPRLAFDPDQVGVEREVFLEHEAELELERIWWPDIEFENEQGERHPESRELVISKEGHVSYSERFQGVFTVDMHLVKFPFDHQNLEIRMESFSWDDRYVVFEPYEEKTGFNHDFKTLEWELHDVHTEVHEKQEVRAEQKFSEYVYSVNVDRDPGFYLYKIVVPLLIIVAFNWATFWMPGEPASVRMERGVIALLTVVAFHQVVSTNLPRIGYLTFMDGVVYVAFASVGLTIMSNIWAQRQEYLGKPENVEKMDAIGRVAFPVVFLVALAVLWIIYHA